MRGSAASAMLEFCRYAEGEHGKSADGISTLIRYLWLLERRRVLVGKSVDEDRRDALWRAFHARPEGAAAMLASPSHFVANMAARFEADRAMAAVDSVASRRLRP